ncbi:MAG: hypothetical protein Q9226_007496 [Calogaya cf. arnoldii]
MSDSSSPEIMRLVEDIGREGQSYGQQEPGAREKPLSLAYKLAAAVEFPSEAIQRIGWAEPARFASTKIAVDLRLFETLKDTKEAGITSADLAKAAEANPMLIGKLQVRVTT